MFSGVSMTKYRSSPAGGAILKDLVSELLRLGCKVFFACICFDKCHCLLLVVRNNFHYIADVAVEHCADLD